MGNALPREAGTRGGCEVEPRKAARSGRWLRPAPAALVCASAAAGRALTSQPANQPLGPGHSGRLPVQGEVAMQRVPAAGRAGARRALVLSPVPPPARMAGAVVAPQPPAPGARGAHGRGGGRPPAARAPLHVHLHHHSPFLPFHLLFLLVLLGLEARVVAAPRLPRARRERRRGGGRGSGRGVPRGRLPDPLHLDLQAPLLAEAARHQPARARRSGRRRPLRVPGLLRLHAARVHHRAQRRPARLRPAPRSAPPAAGAMFLPPGPAARLSPLPAPRPRPPRRPAPSPAPSARLPRGRARTGRREEAAPGPRSSGSRAARARIPAAGLGWGGEGSPTRRPPAGKGSWNCHCLRDPEIMLGSLVTAATSASIYQSAEKERKLFCGMV